MSLAGYRRAGKMASVVEAIRWHGGGRKCLGVCIKNEAVQGAKKGSSPSDFISPCNYGGLFLVTSRRDFPRPVLAQGRPRELATAFLPLFFGLRIGIARSRLISGLHPTET